MDIPKDVRHNKTIFVNGCYSTKIDDVNDVESVQLHGFGDASNMAFGSNVYARVQKKEETHAELVTSKTRVTPLKKETIPKLELLSALTTPSLINTVKGSSVTSSYKLPGLLLVRFSSSPRPYEDPGTQKIG